MITWLLDPPRGIRIVLKPLNDGAVSVPGQEKYVAPGRKCLLTCNFLPCSEECFLPLGFSWSAYT